MKTKKKFEIEHPCIAIEKSVMDKIREMVETGDYRYDEKPSISSFIRRAIYEKLDRMEEK